MAPKTSNKKKSKDNNETDEMKEYMDLELDSSLINDKDTRKEINDNPMKWWVKQTTKFPRLRMIAEYTYSSDIHEIESERKFKESKLIFSAKRNALHPRKGCFQGFLRDYLPKENPFVTDF